MTEQVSTQEKTPESIIKCLGIDAQNASRILAQTPTEKINAVLDTLAILLRERKGEVLYANNIDLETSKEKQLSVSLLDRLALNEDRIESIATGVETVRALDDPTGRVLWDQSRPNGLKIQRVSCPIGVLGMIYESRPNVTVDASILSLKSHNAVILRGGSESFHSSLALHKIIQDALKQHNLPEACISIVPIPDRACVSAMLHASEYIDVMIPRGGKGLIKRVMSEARMPVFSHLEGLCHIYIDKDVDPRIAISVPLNAKMRRTGICGAMETLLLDQSMDKQLAADVLRELLDSGCRIVGDTKAQSLDERIDQASDEDWKTEYLEAKLSCRFIDGVENAVNFINNNGSHHTDSILTNNQHTAEYFLNNVDSGIVMHNASTQFADGGEFGMGAEIGIATGKMHARGPVGLEQLCTYKYHVKGNGQVRP